MSRSRAWSNVRANPPAAGSGSATPFGTHNIGGQAPPNLGMPLTPAGGRQVSDMPIPPAGGGFGAGG